MFHVLSPAYDPAFDRLGAGLPEIGVCSGMLADEWKADLLARLTRAGHEVAWHDVSLSRYRELEAELSRGDTVWILLDGIETDGHPGATVISWLEQLQPRLGLRVIGPRRRFYLQDKPVQKQLLMEGRVETPAWLLPAAEDAAGCFRWLFADAQGPFLIKPADLYCSIGIEPDSVVSDEAGALRVFGRLQARSPRVLVEQFIAGREFTVVAVGRGGGVLVYPPVERVFHAAEPGMGFMDFAMTQALHGDHSAYEMARLEDPELAARIEDITRRACAAVGAESYVRLDLRLDARSGLLYVLEVNACPSVGRESSIEEILALHGIPFDRFLGDLLERGTWDAPAAAQPASFADGPVALRRTPGKGRCVHTTGPVGRGQTLFRAGVDAAGAEDSWKRHYCHRCRRFSRAAYAAGCPACGQVFYCSEACREADTAHAPECEALRRFYAGPPEPEASSSYWRVDIQALSRWLCGGPRPLDALITNHDRLDAPRRREVWRIARRLDQAFAGRIALSNIIATVCATDCNCFSGDDDPDGITLLSARFSMLEHSCLPNATRRTEGGQVQVLALKDIPAGAPVAIRYVSAAYHRSVRRQDLLEYFFFECGCPLCRSASGEMPAEDRALLPEDGETQAPGRLAESSAFSFLRGRLVEHRAVAERGQVCEVRATPRGKGLFAVVDLPAGAPVERFTGATMPYRDVPVPEKTYALLLHHDVWLVCDTPARFINHACGPNCRIAPNLEVRTVRPVRRGEELTISYNRVSREELEASPEHFFWDPCWSFDCTCGCPECAGRVDRYLVVD